MSLRKSKEIPSVAMSTERKSLYEFERFRCDPGEHLLFRDGKPISLAPKAFEILLVLI
jgi:DNA-binding response OmpR family regulator